MKPNFPAPSGPTLGATSNARDASGFSWLNIGGTLVNPRGQAFRCRRRASGTAINRALRRSSIALIYVLLLLAPSRVFADAGCADSSFFTDLKLEPIYIDHIEQEIAPPEEIARLSIAGAGPTPHPLMAVRYTIDGTVAVMHRVLRAEGEGFCAAPETVVFRFGVGSRRVILARSAAAEPCVTSALLAHEAEHYWFVSAVIRPFLRQREAELEQQLRDLKAGRARDEDSAKRTIEVGLFGATARLIEEFNLNEIDKVRELVDSPARLTLLSASCNGRIAELERSVAHDESAR